MPMNFTHALTGRKQTTNLESLLYDRRFLKKNVCERHRDIEAESKAGMAEVRAFV